MDNNMIQNLREQHTKQYLDALLEIVENNTNVLMDDITSLIEKPPLDSMDSIRNKFLEYAKKNKIVLNNESLDQMIGEYREDIHRCFSKIKSLRVNTLSSLIKHFTFVEDSDVFAFYKKDFIPINRDIKKIIKDQLNYSFDHKIEKKMASIFQESIEEDIKNHIQEEITKYMKKIYPKTIMDSFDIKVLVKDTTLMNLIKEQSDRYLFTIQNSRLLNPLD